MAKSIDAQLTEAQLAATDGTGSRLTLDMYLGDRVIGELIFDPASEQFGVSYHPDWLP